MNKDFRPRYTHHPAPPEPCAAPGCGQPSVDFGAPTTWGGIRWEGTTIAPIHARRRYCAEHLA